MSANEQSWNKEKKLQFTTRFLLFAFLYVPLWVQLSMLAGGLVYMVALALLQSYVVDISPPPQVLFIWIFICGGLMAAKQGMRWVQRNDDLPPTFLMRYGVAVSFILLALFFCILIMVTGGNGFNRTVLRMVMFGWITFSPINFLIALGNNFIYIWVPALMTYMLFLVGYCFRARQRKNNPLIDKKNLYICCGLILFALLLAVFFSYLKYQRLAADGYGQVVVKEEVLAQDFVVFTNKDNGITLLREPTTLKFNHDFPRLDGDRMFLPLYASVIHNTYDAQALIKESQEKSKAASQDVSNNIAANPSALSDNDKLEQAFERLIADEADIVFSFYPPQRIVDNAAAKGITLKMTPIAQDALVFFVNAQNPVTNLSLAQIQGIYTGQLNNWQQLGAKNCPVMAFQRTEDKSSQKAMQHLVMQDLKMQKPQLEEQRVAFSAPVMAVPVYRNAPTAIGYSWRYYIAAMRKRKDELRLLEIDGITPDAQAIRQGRYPYSQPIYAITAHPVSDNTRKLIEWLQSPQGQTMLEDAGYVALLAVPSKGAFNK